MHIKTIGVNAAVLILAVTSFAESAGAVPVLCDDARVNHMYVDSAQVSSCLGGGVGNLNGNTATDSFLLTDGAGSGLMGIGSGTFTQTGSTGTFSLAPSLWNTWSDIAIGFKFGTGNRPDEWFVYALDPLVSSGSWQFVNVFNRGGGLSHIQLYGMHASTTVPEPGTLALLGIGMLGAGLARRRRPAR